MKYFVITNTASDNLDVINTLDLSGYKVPLQLGELPVGPSGTDFKDEKVIVSNTYSNSISVVDIHLKKEIKNYYIGSGPTDLKVNNDIAYVVCGESNFLVGYNIDEEKIDFEIKVGENPKNIYVNAINNLAYVSNLEGNTLSVIDLEKRELSSTIILGENPTKIIPSNKKDMLFICESYLGSDVKGTIAMYSIKENRILERFEVGIAPSDIYEGNNNFYISNLGEGSISIIDKSTLKERGKIVISGMPIALLQENNYLYVLDNEKGILIKIDSMGKINKTIAVGKEPSAMVLFTQSL